MNEATLEARLHAILETIFPTFKQVGVVHQQSFTLNFGRRNVKVDLKDPSTYPNRAIYDILLSCDGINIMLFELKNDEHEIEENDILQGLSYARLIGQMPPLVVISNGVETRLYDTYTQKQLPDSTIDIEFIKSRIDTQFKLAISEFQNAVQLILNRQPEVIGKVFRQISKDNFELQLGAVGDIYKPIAKEFLITRHLTHRLHRNIQRNVNLIGLVGSAFSGKTNILYQFFKIYGYHKNLFPLYIDLKDWNYSIFQHLANEFIKETKVSITKEKIRDWLLSVLNIDPAVRLVLLIDNFTEDIGDDIGQELHELINIFKGSPHCIIYSIDEWSYKQRAFVKNRNYKTILGKLTKVFHVGALNDREFKKVNWTLYKSCKAIIQHGGHFCSEFRELRVLRHIAASAISNNIGNGYLQIKPIPTVNLIEDVAENKIFTKEVHDLYKALAITFIADQSIRNKSPHLNIIATSLGAISKAAVEKMLGKEMSVHIQKSALVTEREYMKGLVVFLPKITELLLFHGIDAVHFMLTRALESESESEDIYRLFKKYCSGFPSSDIVACGVLQKIGRSNVELFSYLTQELLEEEPVDESIKAGTRALMFSERFGYLHVNFECDMDEEHSMINHFPYSVLSQLVHLPMESEGQAGTRGYDAFIEVLYKIGSRKEFLGRVGLGSFDKAKPFFTTKLEGVGTFSSGRNGTIETIVQAMENVFYIRPEIIETLFDRAVADLNYPLLWRIDLALRMYLGTPLVNHAVKAHKMAKEIKKIFFKFFNDRTGLDIQDE